METLIVFLLGMLAAAGLIGLAYVVVSVFRTKKLAKQHAEQITEIYQNLGSISNDINSRIDEISKLNDENHINIINNCNDYVRRTSDDNMKELYGEIKQVRSHIDARIDKDVLSQMSVLKQNLIHLGIDDLNDKKISVITTAEGKTVTITNK